MRSLVTLVALAVLSTAANGADATQGATQPAAEKIKCKRVEDSNSGSNIKKRTKVCKPLSEWSPNRVVFERSLEAMRDKGIAAPSTGPGLGTPQ